MQVRRYGICSYFESNILICIELKITQIVIKMLSRRNRLEQNWEKFKCTGYNYVSTEIEFNSQSIFCRTIIR